MRFIFFSKYSNFDEDFRNGEQNSANTLGFGDTWTWIGCVKHSLLPTEISDTTKTEFFQLKLFWSNQKIRQNHCLGDLNSVSDPLTCWLSISVLTWGFFSIYVTMLFGNTSAMTLNFFKKMLKIWCRFQEGGKNFLKNLGFGENGFWLEPLNTHFYQGRILVIASQYVNKQSQDFTSYSERIFRTHVLSHWSKSMAKQLSCRYDQCFGPFNMLTVHKCSDTRLFR